MKSHHFDAMGFSRTYWDFYYGFGLVISGYLLVQAVVLWQLASRAKADSVRVRPIIASFFVSFLVNAILVWKYFFTVPHRYCARTTGSIADGEDVVQDTLARAYYELSELKELPALRPWLFRIAHNRALDYLRRYERRMGEPLDVAVDIAADDGIEPENALARTEAVRAAVSRFLELAPGAAQLRDPQGRARLLARRDRGDARAERAGGQSGAAPRTHAAARPIQSVWSRRASARDLASGRALRHAVQCPRLGWRSRDACR